MENSENGKMDDMGMEEDLMPYPAPDKQYPNASKYSSYESIQTGAMGKAAKWRRSQWQECARSAVSQRKRASANEESQAKD